MKQLSITTVKYWQKRLDLNIFINNLSKRVTYTDKFLKYGFKTGESFSFNEFIIKCRKT